MRSDGKDQALPFFGALAGSKHSENYLSRAFQACFSQSSVFANSVLSLLWSTCGLSGEVPEAKAWICDYQPATPLGGKIRPDLCLRPALSEDGGSRYKPIFIESKVGARLTSGQLQNYKESGTEILVAVTKNWPEVSRNRLRSLGVNHLRWQDVSRSLANTSGHKGKDRFLCDAFLEYLEYSDMAYREEIALPHLEKVGELFVNISKQKYLSFVPGPSFSLADSCLALLRDVRRIAQETDPSLTRCANWGPGYFHVQNESSPQTIDWHGLGFEMFMGGRYRESRILCGLYFSAHEPSEIIWGVSHRGTLVKRSRENEKPIDEFMSGNTVDVDRLADSVVRAVAKWKPF